MELTVSETEPGLKGLIFERHRAAKLKTGLVVQAPGSSMRVSAFASARQKARIWSGRSAGDPECPVVPRRANANPTITAAVAVLAFLAYLPVLVSISFPIATLRFLYLFVTEAGVASAALFAECGVSLPVKLMFRQRLDRQLIRVHSTTVLYCEHRLPHSVRFLVSGTGAVWRKNRAGRRLHGAAGFFAVYEGHQEAVMWLAG